MRIWSLHPKYLDSKGLVALWRETLLAKHVLEGKTKGYRNHPQLVRFQDSPKPLHAINLYLSIVFNEAQQRGFHFDPSKFTKKFSHVVIPVTDEQVAYEAEHLRNKLQKRDVRKWEELKSVKTFEPHPLFSIVTGVREKWEKVS